MVPLWLLIRTFSGKENQTISLNFKHRRPRLYNYESLLEFEFYTKCMNINTYDLNYIFFEKNSQ